MEELAAEADNLPEAPPQEGDVPRLPGRATALMRQFSVAAIATVLPRPAPPVPLVKMALCGLTPHNVSLNAFL